MPKTQSIPGVKETVSLRIDRDVLDVFQEDGAGLAGPHQRRAAQGRRPLRQTRVPLEPGGPPAATQYCRNRNGTAGAAMLPGLETSRMTLQELSPDDAASDRSGVAELADAMALIRRSSHGIHQRPRSGSPTTSSIAAMTQPRRIFGYVARAQARRQHDRQCFARRSHPRSRALAYSVVPSHGGRGYATELAQADARLRLQRPSPQPHRGRKSRSRTPCMRVMEKIGMQREGVFRASVIFAQGRWWTEAQLRDAGVGSRRRLTPSSASRSDRCWRRSIRGSRRSGRGRAAHIAAACW